MIEYFLLVVGIFIVILFLHAKSVEHQQLQQRFGVEKGIRRGKLYGMISGWMEFVLLAAFWLIPQEHFYLPIASDVGFVLGPWFVPYSHFIIAMPFIAVGAWFGIQGVRAVGMEVSDTHQKPEKIITTGLYGHLRHPQYLGWILAHIGCTFLFTAFYSLLFTSLLIVLIYLTCRKEEVELVRDFGDEYVQYQKSVPMLYPRFNVRTPAKNV